MSIFEDYLKRHSFVHITDLTTLEKLWETCPVAMKPAIIERYAALLLGITDFLVLEERFEQCPRDMHPAITERYAELLLGITDLLMLEKRFRQCPHSMKPAITERYAELLPAYLATFSTLEKLEVWAAKRPDWTQKYIYSVIQKLAQEE